MTTKKSTGKLYHSDSHSLTNNRTASGCKPSRSKTYYAVRTGPYIGIWDDWNSIVVLKAAFPHTKYETYDSLARAESFTGMTGLREPITRDSFREMLQRRAAKRVGHSNGNHPVLVTRKLSNQRKRRATSSKVGIRKRIQRDIPRTIVVDGVKGSKSELRTWVGLLIYDDNDFEEFVYGCAEESSNTSLGAKLVALLEALHQAEAMIQNGVKTVQIVCDNRYVLKSLLDARKQKYRGWKTLEGQPIKHVDLIQKLYAIYKRISKSLILTLNQKKDSIFVVDRAKQLATYAKTSAVTDIRRSNDLIALEKVVCNDPSRLI